MLILGHVDQPERDDLILVADVVRVEGALEPRWLGVAGIPSTAELFPRARPRATGRNMTIMSAPQSTDMGSVWRSPAGSMVTAARSVRRQRSRSFPKPTRVTWQSLRAIACSRENSARHMERWCRAHGRSEVDVRVWRVRHRQSGFSERRSCKGTGGCSPDVVGSKAGSKDRWAIGRVLTASCRCTRRKASALCALRNARGALLIHRQFSCDTIVRVTVDMEQAIDNETGVSRVAAELLVLTDGAKLLA